nr:SDR family NAD(P)-dependent oxidoreductase [Aeromonas veronii]
MSEWQGRTVWVTGAAQGIGHAVAGTFAEAGASVVSFDLQLAEALPGNVKRVVIDVSDSEAVTRCCEQLLDEGLGPDVLVNVAGVLATGRIDEVDDALLQRTFAINTFAPFYLMRALTPWFQGRRRGAIVNVSSNAGRVPRVGMGIYGASKAALTSLTQTAGLELAPYGVRCNLVSPGSTRTPMLYGMWQEGGTARRGDTYHRGPARAVQAGDPPWQTWGPPTRWLPACCFSPPMPPAISPCRIWWSMAVPPWGV